MRFMIGLVALLVLGTSDAWAAMPLPRAFGPNTYTIPAALESLLALDPPKPMPKTAFLDPSGAPVSFSRFKGKRVLAFFWSQACVPCLKTMPELNAMAESSGKYFEVVPIAIDSHGAVGTKSLLARQKWSHLKGYSDPNRELATALGISMLPTSVLIDPSGMATAILLGPQAWNSQETLSLIVNGPSTPLVPSAK